MKRVEILEYTLRDGNYAILQQLLIKDLRVLFHGTSNNMEEVQW